MKTFDKSEVRNIWEARSWFEVLQTNEQTQTAVMKLDPGKSSSDEPELHEDSEQVLLVIEGEVLADVEGDEKTLREGDVVVIPAGTKHKFTNRTKKPVMTFNVYAPAEYPADMKE